MLLKINKRKTTQHLVCQNFIPESLGYAKKLQNLQWSFTLLGSDQANTFSSQHSCFFGSNLVLQGAQLDLEQNYVSLDCIESCVHEDIHLLVSIHSPSLAYIFLCHSTICVVHARELGSRPPIVQESQQHHSIAEMKKDLPLDEPKELGQHQPSHDWWRKWEGTSYMLPMQHVALPWSFHLDPPASGRSPLERWEYHNRQQSPPSLTKQNKSHDWDNSLLKK